MNIKEIPNEDIDFFKSIFSSKKDSIQDDIIFRIKYIIHLSHCFLLQHPTKEDFLETLFSQICDSIDIKIENSPKDFVFYTISEKNPKDPANVVLSKAIIDHADKIELTSYVLTSDVNKDGLSAFSNFTLKNCIPICFLKMKQNQLVESIYNLVYHYLEQKISIYEQTIASLFHYKKEKFYISEKETNNQATSSSENSLCYYDQQDQQTKQVKSAQYYQSKYDSPQEQNYQEQDFEYLYLKYDKKTKQWNILENDLNSVNWEIYTAPLSDYPEISYRFNYCSGRWETVCYFYSFEKDQWIEYDLLYKYHKNSPSGICNIPAYPYCSNNDKKTPEELMFFEYNKNVQTDSHWNISYNKETKTWETTRTEFDKNLFLWVDMKFPYSNYKNPLNKSFIYARKLSSFVLFGVNDLTPFEIKSEEIKSKEEQNENQTPYKKIHIDIDD